MQQDLPFRKPPPTHGGRRDGAGRKPSRGRRRVPHRTRAVTKPRFPVQVTVRMRPEIARLRNFDLIPVLRRAFVHGCNKGVFRICQFSIQGNHMHMICEAVDNEALARGMQAWAVRVARGLNKKLGRTGAVFADRYHARILRTPTECRNSLCYVLQNARRHGERLSAQWHGMDPFSSAWWFDGWKDAGWREGLLPPESRTVAEAQTWLLRVGWRQQGLIAIEEVPPAGRMK